MEINYLAVGLAALAAFFIGFLWYTILFSRSWQKLIGMGNKGMGVESTKDTPNIGCMLAISAGINIIMAGTLAWFIGENATWFFGLCVGLVVGMGFIALTLGSNYMYAGKPLKLWIIDGGHSVVVFGIMGLIIGAM
jgi:hypothetical protein